MLRKLRLDALKAELGSAHEQLRASEQYEDVVGLSQFRKRIRQITDEIADLSAQRPTTASVALYFSGRPILGTQGIAADFAGRCLENFQDLVSKTFARREVGALGERGPVPLRQNTEMMVTGVTHGSFGFVLTEMTEQEAFFETQLKDVVSDVSTTLEKFGGDSDSDFLDFAAELDQRTIISLRNFFQVMDASSATVRIVEDDKEVQLDAIAVHRGRQRAESATIDEDVVEMRGTAVHVLPDNRSFEFFSADGEVLHGKASVDAVESYLYAIAMKVNVANANVVAHMQVRTVHALNREPRSTYRMMALTIVGASLA
jgi:hypothetical protein